MPRPLRPWRAVETRIQRRQASQLDQRSLLVPQFDLGPVFADLHARHCGEPIPARVAEIDAATAPVAVWTRIPASPTPFEPLLGGLTTPTRPVVIRACRCWTQIALPPYFEPMMSRQYGHVVDRERRARAAG